MSLFYAKQYKAIARAVNDSREYDYPTNIKAYWLVKILTIMFRNDNPRFNEDDFRVACGEKPEHTD